MEKAVQFYSESVPMAGVLFLPENISRGEKRPGIVMCHGFTAVKEVLFPEIAKRKLLTIAFLVPVEASPDGKLFPCDRLKIFVMLSLFYRINRK